MPMMSAQLVRDVYLTVPSKSDALAHGITGTCAAADVAPAAAVEAPAAAVVAPAAAVVVPPAAAVEAPAAAVVAPAVAAFRV